jgi:16S rRNA processing protein RimM
MNKLNQSVKVELGGCRSPHGIKGGFNCFLYNTQESILKKGMALILMPENDNSSLPPEGTTMTIAKISIGGKEHKAILYLEEVNGRIQAEKMLPFSISLTRDTLPKIDKNDEFYVVDLLGCQVVTAESKPDPIGKISDYYQLENDSIVFTIETEAERFDLPFTKQFFPRVDLEAKEVEIVMPEIEVVEDRS